MTDSNDNPVSADPVSLDNRVAIITGGPKMFCAGTDLADGPGELTDRGGEYGVIRRARTKPLIAAVNGFEVTAGFE